MPMPGNNSAAITLRYTEFENNSNFYKLKMSTEINKQLCSKDNPVFSASVCPGHIYVQY